MAGIQLRDYQKDAVDRLSTGKILCGGVGSGKSRTALAYYYIQNGGAVCTEKYKKMNKPADLYIITTARKRDTAEWEGELAPFLLSPQEDINYYKNKVVIDSWNNIKKYTEVRGAFFIFDEQRVIGYGSWTKSFLRIAKANDWILLSATPGDTWQDYIPVFIANGFYKNKTEFIRNHVVYKRFSKFPQVDRYFGIGRLMRLRDKILVDMDFQRETVPHHEDVWVTYNKILYRDIFKTRWDPYKSQPLQNAADFCYCLRKAVNTDASRAIAVLEILENHPRAIIFYNFDYELDILRALGEELDGVDVAEWNGHKHQPVPDSKRWIYLVQYTAGSEGWNCVSTDTIIFWSQNYSYKMMVQAAGRIDRMNTPYTDLYFYHLKSRSPIDLAIAKALHSKKKFNETKFYGG